MRAEVLDQAGQAWLLAGDPVRAYAASGQAVSLQPNDPDLLLDRAEAAASAGYFDKAVADLDHVLKTEPARVDALIYRASANRALGRLDPALADVEKALAQVPKSVPGLLERGNIRRLAGDRAAVRQASVDIALFFCVSALLIMEIELTTLLGISTSLVTATVVMLALALPYLLLRLVSDFTRVHWTFMRAAEAALIGVALGYLLAPEPVDPALSLAVAAYFVIVLGYCAVAFIGSARRSVGVTRRRMTAVAAGTLFLGADVVVSVFASLVPDGVAPLLSAIAQLIGLASGLSYFVGFAPPRILRRAWQEPELRQFLQRAASLPRLPTTSAIVDALQSGAANTLGGRAAIGLYDQGKQVLRFQDPHAVLPNEVGRSRFLVWRVFEAQRAGYFPDAARAHPEMASVYRRAGVASLLIAPISAAEKRLGALQVYTDRPPIFSQGDLSLTQLFADQAAVVLESRALIDDAARVRAAST